MARLIEGNNDLATTHPSVASQWHPTKNGTLLPTHVTQGSGQKVWWQCEKGHDWEARVGHRSRGKGCPVCSGRQILVNYNDLATVDPGLASEWHPTKNGDLLPTHVTQGARLKVWWQCKETHDWEAVINDRSHGRGCPVCSGRQVLVNYNDLATTNPSVALEWHPTKNGFLLPIHVTQGSNQKVWWQCEKTHDWEARVGHRTGGKGCPVCSGRQVLVNYNDLATTNPSVALEWHPTKNGDLLPTHVTQGARLKVWWQCVIKDDHEWEATVNSRSSGTGCPDCIIWRNESEFCQMFTDVTDFTFVSSHVMGIRNSKRSKIQVDILNEKHKVAIEYDGHWSHGGNKLYGTTYEGCADTDAITTEALIREGYKVIRIRETPLEHLTLKDPHFAQVSFKAKTDKLITVKKCITILQHMGVPIVLNENM